ncbi:MAG: hypothetical protein RIB67_09615 [Miltoncostaeaceae bacterium]
MSEAQVLGAGVRAAVADGGTLLMAMPGDGAGTGLVLVARDPGGAERWRRAIEAPARGDAPPLLAVEGGDALVWGEGRHTTWLDRTGEVVASFPVGDRAALLGRGAVWRIVASEGSDVLERHRITERGVAQDVMPLTLGRPAGQVALARAAADGTWAYATARSPGLLGGKGAMLLAHAEWPLPPALTVGARNLPLRMVVVDETVFTSEPRGLTRDGRRYQRGRWFLFPGPAGLAAVGPQGPATIEAEGAPVPLEVEAAEAMADADSVRHSGGLVWWEGCAWDAAGDPVCGLVPAEGERPLWCDGHSVVLWRADDTVVRRPLAPDERVG